MDKEEKSDRKENRRSLFGGLMEDIRSKAEGTKRRSRAIDEPAAAEQPAEASNAAQPRRRGRDSVHGVPGTSQVDNDTHDSSSGSDNDGDNDKLEQLIWKRDRLEVKLEDNIQARDATQATIDRLHSSDVTDKGIRFNRNQEQTELAKAEKRIANKKKAIKTITQDIEKLTRRIDALRKGPSEREGRLVDEPSEDGEDRPAIQKMLSAVPKAFQSGGKVLNRLRNKHHPDDDSQPVEIDVQPSTPILPPVTPRGRSAATSSVTLERSPSPPPRHEPPASLHRRRSQTLSELQPESVVTPLSRNRNNARSIGSVTRDPSSRTLTSRYRKLLTPLRRGKDKHAEDSEQSALEDEPLQEVDEESDAVSNGSVSYRVSPNLPLNVSEDLIQLLVPNADFVPDGNAVNRLELKVQELQQELQVADTSAEQLQAQVQTLTKQADAQAALMERIEARIAQEASQLEQGVQALEGKLAAKLSSNDKQLEQGQHELARLRAECEALVSKSRHSSATVAAFVEELQLKERALSLASAESIWTSTQRMLAPWLGNSSEQGDQPNRLISGMVLVVVALYIIKWWLGQ
eukprot:m.114072 g.114072  ORF g.114072 m.114072 type:complete len:575 (+) comp15463_c0_seq2:133-1857(+)